MPAEKERRFSRLTALLRRPSSSSAKNAASDSTTSTSSTLTTSTPSPTASNNNQTTANGVKDTVKDNRDGREEVVQPVRSPWHSFATPPAASSAHDSIAASTTTRATRRTRPEAVHKPPEEADGLPLKGQKLGANSRPNRAQSP
ncbi:hypothetical protein FQN49_006772, partial [Arthroderma sp. PD_2]